MPMLSPMTKTMACSSMVRGLVRKKKARVRWKRETEVMMVLAAMSGMAGRFCLCLCLYLFFSLSLSLALYIYMIRGRRKSNVARGARAVDEVVSSWCRGFETRDSSRNGRV